MIMISQQTLQQGLENLEEILTDVDVQRQLDAMTEDAAKDYVVAALYQNLTKLQPTPLA